MMKNLGVLGAGAIGSSVGADLTRAGHNVVLIDQWPAHVEAMKATGLLVTMREEEFRAPVQALHLAEMKDSRYSHPERQLDIVFLTSKSYDTRWLVEFVRPYLKPDGVLVSLQNSLNNEWIAPILGEGRDLACALELSAELMTPGRVLRHTDRQHTRFVLGETDGTITPRLQEVAQILSAVGQTQVSTNVWGAKWTKLVLNCMLPFDAITGVRAQYCLKDPRIVDVCVRLGKETAKVGQALGYTLEPIIGLSAQDVADGADDMFKKLVAGLFADVGIKSRSHLSQDLEKGRRTEIDYINGLVVRKGQEVGVPTPMNAAVTSLVHQVEDGTLKLDLANLEVLVQLL